MSTPKPGNSMLYSISQQDPQSLPGFRGFPHHIKGCWRAKTPEGPLKPARPRHPHQLSRRFSYSGTTSATKKWRGLWRWEEHSGSLLTQMWLTQLPSPVFSIWTLPLHSGCTRYYSRLRALFLITHVWPFYLRHILVAEQGHPNP